MGKIDLIDNGWVDLVFEGKNQTYGAYQLRKSTGVRNLKALITMFVGFAIIAAIVIAKVSIENYIAAQNAAIEADVELASLAEKKEAKVEKNHGHSSGVARIGTTHRPARRHRPDERSAGQHPSASVSHARLRRKWQL